MKEGLTIRYEQALRLAERRFTGATEMTAERMQQIITECYQALVMAEEALKTELEKEQANPKIGLRRG